MQRLHHELFTRLIEFSLFSHFDITLNNVNWNFSHSARPESPATKSAITVNRQTKSHDEEERYNNQYVFFSQLLTRMFEGKYFLNRITIISIHKICDVFAVEFRRSSSAVIYSAQILAVFGEKFFLADVCLQR